MTTLTPLCDAMLAALDQGQRKFDACAPNDEARREFAASNDLMRGALLPWADAVDADVGIAQAQAQLESALANTLLSHAMNVGKGEPDKAVEFASGMLTRVARLTLQRIRENRPTIGVVQPVCRPAAEGRA